jgi:predicted dehydrogenase
VIRVGVIGYGYWGPNLVRNFWEADETSVVAVSDLTEERLLVAKSRYPALHTTVDHRELFADPEIDAIAIATPVATHHELALSALRAGKHVFVEKPLTQTAAQASELLREARQRDLVIHVDHTFVYTGAVRKIKELVESGEVGEIFYYDSVRVNLGLVQPDVSVIWDLAVHDLAILAHVVPMTPTAVSATGMGHVPGKPASIAFMTLFYDGNMIAHIHVNWLAPVKVRRILVGGSRRMIVWDDVEPSEKVKVYDKGISMDSSRESIYRTMVGYRTGDMYAPKLDATEALSLEVRHFARCIEQGERPITGGEAGLTVVRILEAASQSMALRGQPVPIPAPSY